MLRDTEEFDRCTVAKQISEDIKQKECHTEDTRCEIATEIADTVVEKECQTEKRREIIINTVRDILSKDDCVLEAYIFGSLVRSDFEETSDIDIYIIPSPECPIRTKYWYNEMIGEIDGHKIDCGVLHISKLEKGHISEWSRKYIQDDLRGYEPFIMVKPDTVVEKECSAIVVNWDIRKLYPDETLEWMTPESFLAKVPHPSTTLCSALVGLNRVSIEEGGQGYDIGSLKSIHKRILEGEELDALDLNYTNMWYGYPSHEGRHRAVVCYKLDIDKVPVIVRR